jgi:hypothetical protein
MTATLAHARDTELSPEMVELLTAAAQTTYGRVCYPYQCCGPVGLLLVKARALGLIYYDGATPIINDAGRKAVGAPTELALMFANRRELFAKPGEAVTRRPTDDPRSRVTYQCYRDARMFCTLVVKLAEPPTGARGLKCSMNGDPLRYFYLPLRQIIIEPESKGSFVLAVVPKWLARPVDPKRITELANVIPDLCDSVEWTEDQRTDWKQLRRKASIINTRIRSGGERRSSDRQNGVMFA